MQENRVRVLIIEDEAVLAMDLCDTLETEGYYVVGIANNGKRALEIYQQNQVDLVLCDINIKGEWDGIETINQLQNIKNVPVIYITALADKETKDRAKLTYPAAYLFKPINNANLNISIELAIQNFLARDASGYTKDQNKITDKDVQSKEVILKIEQSIFIKHNYQFVRIDMQDIIYLEADNTYTTIVTSDKKYSIRLTLNLTLLRLGVEKLMRVHRSYAVNVRKIKSFNEKEIVADQYTIPMGRQYKDEFMRIFQIN
ncbi:DNA-binding response regulator [Siphonobacter sp. SORGH_AS_0500]|uniref:response regulator n=1 Tax=Siphonobacter sp. SORGH_AS_0500 TaxID=1864824 RepID=UPI000CC999D1|nr:response regulator [Siphonobacter sp. SORGH_AS_0500]PKK37544.1 DNA-binding response regulator [Siphonobacter sp. SORGH_AS_0500]